MILLSDLIKKISFMKSDTFVTYAKNILVLIKMIKMNLSYTVKSEIIVTTKKDLEELLIPFEI